MNCPKCLSFWATTLYGLLHCAPLPALFATSFLCAWMAMWLDMGMGVTDIIYEHIYEKIYTSKDDEATAKEPTGNPCNRMPELSEQ